LVCQVPEGDDDAGQLNELQSCRVVELQSCRVAELKS
jgi:hypothetical protein